MSKFGPLILSLILCSLNQAASEVYYITTDSTNLCIVQSCLTLSQFAANSSDYLCPNTTLVFLPGTHHLSSVTLSLSNVDNFVMKSKISTAQIHCTNSAPSMHFDQLQYIHITNLEFIGCGGNHVKHVSEFVLQDTKFEGQVNSGTALELIETTALIVNSTFVSTKKVIDHCITTSFGTFTAAAGGAITATNSTVDISQSVFEDNGAGCGGAISAEQSIINVSGNVFINNNASFYGGVLFSFSSTITIKASMFYTNSAGEAGGVMFFYSSNITIGTSEFHDNGAPNGGVHSSYISDITIEASKFYNNSATVGGVLISIDNSTVTIEKSEFHNNNASVGGVLSAAISTITIETSKFHNNSANSAGGVLYSIISTTITIGSSNFTKNRSPVGAVIYGTDNFKIQLHSSLLFDNNLADRSAVIYLSDSEFTGQGSENFTFSNNLGSLVAFNSNVTLIGYARFMNNHPPQTASGDFQEGGAITLFQSNIFFDIVGNIEHNSAEYGGAIHSTESKLYVNGNVSIAHNTATRNGGGVYLATSELNCQQMSTFVLFNNTAVHRGGGLHATSSSIKAISTFAINYYFQSPYIDNNQYLGTTIVFISNRAVKGGGLSLEANAKLYVLKYNDREISTTIFFIANSADYGGAVYVDDDTNPGTCASDTETECLFQVLALYNMQYLQSEVIMTQIIVYFSQNNANISGSILYGGLLDRCAVSQFAEFYLKHSISNKGRGYGISYVLYYSHYELHNEVLPNTLLISSLPVQVCICNSNEPNCNSESYTEVKKGETFTLSVVAVDQVD